MNVIIFVLIFVLPVEISSSVPPLCLVIIFSEREQQLIFNTLHKCNKCNNNYFMKN